MIDTVITYFDSLPLAARVILACLASLIFIGIPLCGFIGWGLSRSVDKGKHDNVNDAASYIIGKYLPVTAIQLFFVFAIMAVFSQPVGWVFGDEKWAFILFLIFCVFGGKVIGQAVEKGSGY